MRLRERAAGCNIYCVAELMFAYSMQHRRTHAISAYLGEFGSKCTEEQRDAEGGEEDVRVATGGDQQFLPLGVHLSHEGVPRYRSELYYIPPDKNGTRL